MLCEHGRKGEKNKGNCPRPRGSERMRDGHLRLKKLAHFSLSPILLPKTWAAQPDRLEKKSLQQQQQ